MLELQVLHPLLRRGQRGLGEIELGLEAEHLLLHGLPELPPMHDLGLELRDLRLQVRHLAPEPPLD